MMYNARQNVGLYLELRELINYVSDNFNDETRVDYLLKQFKNPGLTHKEIKEVSQLIEKYLPPHIECDNTGCYIVTQVEDIDSGQTVELRSPVPEMADTLRLPIQDSVIVESSHRQLVEV